MVQNPHDLTANEWVSFPGRELEGRRPRALCPACREALARAARSGRAPGTPAPDTGAHGPQPPGTVASGPRHAKPLCFHCYRTELDRQRAIAAAGRLDTASEERFQVQLPFEPVNHPRLGMLKADRGAARTASRAMVAGPLVDRRRRAQMAARHALQQIAGGLNARRLANADRDRAMAAAFHAAELQLPESWMPFVTSR